MEEAKTFKASRGLIPETNPLRWHISLRVLGIVVISFVSGIVAILIFSNATKSENVTFSTTSLIGFLFGIALSAASTVLAIVAISLGKSSEQVMIERSDQSIRLQNEVFTRTTEALSRIESSTGVTEKRIEDMISGRAGDISHRIANRLLETRGTGEKSRKSIEENIKQSLIAEFSAEQKKKEQQERRQREKLQEEAEKTYDEFTKAVLLELSNSPGVNAIKIGRGFFDTTGEELVDGVFLINENRIAVAVFSVEEIVQGGFEGFPKFLTDLSREIAKGNFSNVYLVFDGELGQGSPFRSALEEFKQITRKEIADKFHTIIGTPETAGQMILKDLAASNGRPVAVAEA